MTPKLDAATVALDAHAGEIARTIEARRLP